MGLISSGKHFVLEKSKLVYRAGLFDMALKNLGFLRFFLKKTKNLISPNLGFLENKNLMSNLSF